MNSTTIFRNAARQMDELLLFEGLGRRALAIAANSKAQLTTMRKAIKVLKRDHPLLNQEHFDAEYAKADKREAWAKNQAQEGNTYLYELLLVRLWSVLENVITGIVINRLGHLDSLPNNPHLDRVKVPYVQFMSLDESDRIELVYDELCRNINSNLKIGVGRFESLLEIVALSGPVHESVRRGLLELSIVRNILIHKDGQLDRRALSHCPWLKDQHKSRLSIRVAHFFQYTISASWYLHELDRRIALADEKHTPLSQTTTQEGRIEILADIQNSLK